MAESEFKRDVFISYSHKDEEWADKVLRQHLDNAGLKVCIDYRDFEAGKMALLNMQDAAKQSKHVVLVLTRNWLSSEWSLFEALVGGTKDPAGLQTKLVPLLCEAGIEKAINDFIAMRTWVDFTRKDREQIAWKQLFTALGNPNALIPSVPISTTNLPTSHDTSSWYLAYPYPMLPNFTGRVAEQAFLTEWLESDKIHSLYIIHALGGFGKSALVWHWLSHNIDPIRWPKVVWWSFYEGDASFENFLKETLKYLKVDPQQISPRQQAESLSNLLHRPGILLILDGFERVLRAYGNMGAAYQGDDIEKIETARDCISPYAEIFLKAVCAFSEFLPSKVLMTTRLIPRAVERHGQFLQGCLEKELLAIEKDDAVDLFRASGIRGIQTDIEAACVHYGFHPLSLRLLAGLISNDRQNPGDITVTKKLDITEDIKQNKHHVLEQAYNTLTLSQQKLLGNIACFRTAIDYESLHQITAVETSYSNRSSVNMPEAVSTIGETLRSMIHFLRGRWPGTRNRVEQTKTSLFNVTIDNDLKSLESRGLLHWDRQSNKYDLHPIVRRYAYERMTQNDRTTIHTKLRNYFAAVDLPTRVKTLDDLYDVIELYHHTVRAGEFDKALMLYRDRLADQIYYQFGAYETEIELLRSLFPNNEDKPLRIHDQKAQIWILNALGTSYSLNGQPHRAIQVMSLANNMDQETDHKSGVVIGLANLAQDQLSIGAFRQAYTNLKQEIKLSDEIKDYYQGAIGHQQLGRLLAFLGMWVESEKELGIAENIFSDTIEGQIDLASGISAHRTLRLLLMCRDPNILEAKERGLAIAHAQRTLENTKKTSYTWRHFERDFIRAHWLSGAAYRLDGQLDEAERHLSEALRRCRSINVVADEADILLDLARLLYDQKTYEQAKSLAEEALTITERCGYVLQGADVNLFLAELALTLDPSPEGRGKAKDYAETALKLATCDGPPYYYKVAYHEAERMLERMKGEG